MKNNLMKIVFIAFVIAILYVNRIGNKSLGYFLGMLAASAIMFISLPALFTGKMMLEKSSNFWETNEIKERPTGISARIIAIATILFFSGVAIIGIPENHFVLNNIIVSNIIAIAIGAVLAWLAKVFKIKEFDLF